MNLKLENSLVVLSQRKKEQGLPQRPTKKERNQELTQEAKASTCRSAIPIRGLSSKASRSSLRVRGEGPPQPSRRSLE